MKKLFVYPYVLWIGAFIVAPLILILYYSLTTTTADGQTIFTLEHFRRFFGRTELDPGEYARLYVEVATHSIRMAVVTTIVCLLLGYPLAYILSGKGFAEKSFLIFMFIAPMWMNFLVRTYAWLTILERNGLVNTLLRRFNLPTMDILFTDAAVQLGMVYNFLPFMVLPIYASLARMDKRIIEAAQDLGASPRNVFFKIVLPFSLPGIISGITMVFMPAVATFIIPNLLGGRQYFMLGNLIELQFLNIRNWNFGSVAAVLLVLMMFVSIAVLSFVDRRKDDEGSNLV